MSPLEKRVGRSQRASLDPFACLIVRLLRKAVSQQIAEVLV